MQALTPNVSYYGQQDDKLCQRTNKLSIINSRSKSIDISSPINLTNESISNYDKTSKSF